MNQETSDCQNETFSRRFTTLSQIKNTLKRSDKFDWNTKVIFSKFVKFLILTPCGQNISILNPQNLNGLEQIDYTLEIKVVSL